VTTAAAAGPSPTAELDTSPTRGALVTGRGETTIAPVVAEKIAARAASEVDGVGGVLRPRLSGMLPWTHAAGRTGPASADAAVDGGTVTLDLTVNVLYPRPVGAVTAQVRERVSRRLAELCGLQAKEVNILVPELVRETRTTRRRVE
jgi:uncharacterized alkaline shock family protein YloU